MALTKSKTIGLISIIAWSGYMLWCVVNQSGLYAYLLNLEFEMFDGYYPLYTGLLLWGIPTGILAGKFFPEQMVKLNQAPTNDNDEISKLTSRKGLFKWLSILTVLAGTALMYFGFQMDTSGKTPDSIDLVALGSDAPPRGFVEIEGIALTDIIMGIEETINEYSTIIAYAPIVPADDTVGYGEGHAPFKYFQRVETYGSTPGEGLFNKVGVLKRQPLPAMVRSWYEKEGINIAKETYILSGGKDSMQDTILTAGALSIVVALFSMAIFFGIIMRVRKLRKALAE